MSGDPFAGLPDLVEPPIEVQEEIDPQAAADLAQEPDQSTREVGTNLHRNASGELVRVDGTIPGWIAGTGSTLVTSALYPSDGSRSFRVTRATGQGTGTASMRADFTDMPKATQDEVLSASFRVASGGIERTVYAEINCWTAAGADIAFFASAAFEETDEGHVRVFIENITVPANTDRVTVRPRIDNVAEGEYHYIDEIMLERSSVANEFAPATDDAPLTPSFLAVDQLSAISADMGTLTAGVIRGGVLETSAVNPKVRHDTTGLFVTDASGNKPMRISGTGLDFMVGVDFYTAERSVRWLTGASMLSEIVSSSDTSPAFDSITMRVKARPDGTTNEAFSQLQTYRAAGTESARLGVTHYQQTNFSSAYVVAQSRQRKILDSAGVSSFLTLLTDAYLLMDHGSGVVSITAGNASGSQVVNHGLGVTPSTCLVLGSNASYLMSVSAATSTTITVVALHYQATVGAASAGFWWVVLG